MYPNPAVIEPVILALEKARMDKGQMAAWKARQQMR